MKNSRPFSILDDITHDHIPDDTDLIPRLSARVKRKRIVTRRLATALIVVLIVLAASGAAYALGRSFGYIPGIGLVGRDAPLRVMQEPVSSARDGITLRVQQAVLSADKTVILLSAENIPADKLSVDGPASGCAISAELILPDGSRLPMTKGWSVGSWDPDYTDSFTFGPMPAGVSAADLRVPCIPGAAAGALPQDWELRLHFVAAPPNMTVVPVTQVVPLPQTSHSDTMKLEKVIETENGYVLAGTFSSADLPQGAQAVQFSVPPLITDAARQHVPFNFANYQLGLPAEQTLLGTFTWAFELTGKQFNWPLTITVDSVAVQYPGAQAAFEFEAGPNPQEGQEWNLNLDLSIAGIPARVLKARRTTDGYTFNFESQTMFHGVDLAINDSLPGITGMDDPNHFSSSVKFRGAIPSGKMTVVLTRPVVALAGKWQLQWRPDKVTVDMGVPTESPQACLTIESWKAALANPASIPAELNRKVLVSGRVLEDGKPASEENTGIYISRLDGGEKQEILRGHNWASPSFAPDGLQVVYDGTGFAGADSLDIVDLTSGNTRPIPNTTADDMAPLWSPDGSRIAFVRFNEQDLYFIRPDGSGLQKITNGSEYEQLVDWWPDGSAFVYSTRAKAGTLLRKFDVNSGAVSDLFVVTRPDLGVAVSPNGREIAFIEKEAETSISVYVSRLDGSDRRRVGFMDNYLGVLNPRWSPDGNWLLVNVLDTPNMDNADAAAALVNVQSCQIIPVPILGTMRALVP